MTQTPPPGLDAAAHLAREWRCSRDHAQWVATQVMWHRLSARRGSHEIEVDLDEATLPALALEAHRYGIGIDEAVVLALVRYLDETAESDAAEGPADPP